MGCMETLSVTRDEALLALAKAEFGSLSDTEIEERLSDKLEVRLMNVSIGWNSNAHDLEVLDMLVSNIGRGDPDECDTDGED